MLKFILNLFKKKEEIVSAHFDPKQNPILAAIENRTNARKAVMQATSYISVAPGDTQTLQGKTALINAVNWIPAQQLAGLDFSNLNINTLINLAAAAVDAIFPALTPFVAFVVQILNEIFPPTLVPAK